MTYATYSPEDNKLRLYCGRVPREEYLALKEEGWTSTPKQSCDFAATWTPERLETALSYCEEGGLEDEDQSPEDRAADRAERFGGYLDKRLSEATGRADQFDAGPSVHGFQSQDHADRAAARHDRIAGYACDAWSKAEYWQRRTAGVIRHALHKSTPGVRMGRIKVIEADIRRFEGYARNDEATGQYRERNAIWLSHLKLRLGYEMQMLEAQGGRLEQCDVEVGGKLGGKLIIKANKSSATGRITSVSVIGPRVEGWAYQVSNIPNTEFAEYYFELERFRPDAYTAPTEESMAELKAFKALLKASKPEKEPCPLINPTDADAQRLQDRWNEIARDELAARNKRNGYTLSEFVPATVLRITQATYSQHSKGSYCSCSTRGVFAGGFECDSYYGAAQKMRAKHGREVCQVRRTSSGNYQSSRVIILTDKPQKPLPEAVWTATPQEVTA